MSRSRAVMVSYGSPSFVVVGLFCHTAGCRLLQIACSFWLFFDDFRGQTENVYFSCWEYRDICNIWLLNGLGGYGFNFLLDDLLFGLSRGWKCLKSRIIMCCRLYRFSLMPGKSGLFNGKDTRFLKIKSTEHSILHYSAFITSI